MSGINIGFIHFIDKYQYYSVCIQCLSEKNLICAKITFCYFFVCPTVSQVIRPKAKVIHFLDSKNPHGFGSQSNLTLVRLFVRHIWPKFKSWPFKSSFYCSEGCMCSACSHTLYMPNLNFILVCLLLRENNVPNVVPLKAQ